MLKKIAVLLLTICATGSFAQQYRPLSSGQIYQRLQQLNVLGTVMYVAAHPDDENTRLLSYLVHHDHVRTVYLSLTRGDGGQNILGNEQGGTLGLIRTHELIEARKIDGAEQVFTPVIDFGFTKSPEETFKFWDQKILVNDVKIAIEKYRPDVIICRFPTTGEGGHGQHTVSAIVAEEAYKQLQADKNTTWLPTRLLFNSFRFGNRNTTSESQFKVPVNQYNSILGEGYGEMAGRSRSVHKSQGAGTPQTVGVSNEYFKFLAGKEIKQSLYDDVDITWGRVGRKDIGDKVLALIKDFNFVQPEKNLKSLIDIRKEIETVRDIRWRAQKLIEIDELILSCAGIMAEVLTDKQTAVAGSTLPINVQLIARAGNDVRLDGIFFYRGLAEEQKMSIPLVNDSLYKFSTSGKLDATTPLTEPYWLSKAATTASYQYDPKYGGMPETPNHLEAKIQVNILGQPLSFDAPLSYKYLDPVKGDVVQPLRVVPEIAVAPLNNLLVVENGKRSTIPLRLTAYADISNLTVEARLGDKVIAAHNLNSLKNGADTLCELTIPGNVLEKEKDGRFVTLVARVGDREYNKELHLIQYPHLPDLQYFTPSQMKLVKKNWNVAVNKIGYIKGAGDLVDASLSLLGLQVEQVPEVELTNANTLSKYDAIVLGVRALNTQSKMNAWMPVLLKYVELGGTLLVQYNTNQNLQTNQFGPYPFSLSRDRVTEEDAKVTFTNPDARLLQFPNKIITADFDNWVQERGIYFPSGYEEHYKTLLSMHDVNESPLNSAIIYTPFGKGQFIYTSLVFFRQLPAGNIGAIRLMMNLLSAGK